MIAIDCRILADFGVGEASGCLFGRKQFDIFAQRTLVAFQRQDIISLLVDDLLRDLTLTADRIDRDDGALDRQQVEKLWDCYNLIGLFCDLDLTEHEALACGEG